MKKLNAKKNTNKPEIPGKVKKGYRIYVMAVLALTLTMSMGVTAFAAGDPITVVNNLSDFIFGLIRAVGLILLGWGIVQVGLSFQSHDPSQRSNGFLALAAPYSSCPFRSAPSWRACWAAPPKARNAKGAMLCGAPSARLDAASRAVCAVDAMASIPTPQAPPRPALARSRSAAAERWMSSATP